LEIKKFCAHGANPDYGNTLITGHPQFGLSFGQAALNVFGL